MQKDVGAPTLAAANPVNHANTSADHAKSQPSRAPWLKTPEIVKRVFDRFPLRTHEACELPQGRTSSRDEHALFVFTTEADAKGGRPSYNPGCLKWQAYLRFQGLDFVTVPSNNHASPSGALPYLLPAESASSERAPIPSNRLQRWVKNRDQSGAKRSQDREPNEESSRDSEDNKMRYDAYLSLLDLKIRNAYARSPWLCHLCTLYLCRSNFDSVARPLYVDPSTSNGLARLTVSSQLRDAAQAELLKQAATIDAEVLYQGSSQAFEALSELLGEGRFFFDAKEPSLFDASVFAYSNILLDNTKMWKETRMIEDLQRFENIVKHREHILQQYF